MGTTVTALERQRRIDEVQEARKAARKAKIAQDSRNGKTRTPKSYGLVARKTSNERPVETVSAPIVKHEAPLHELWNRTLKTMQENHKSRSPLAIIHESYEYRRAVRLCTEAKANERVAQAIKHFENRTVTK